MSGRIKGLGVEDTDRAERDGFTEDGIYSVLGRLYQGCSVTLAHYFGNREFCVAVNGDLTYVTL